MVTKPVPKPAGKTPRSGRRSSRRDHPAGYTEIMRTHHYRVVIGSAAVLAVFGLAACEPQSGDVTGRPTPPNVGTTGRRPSPASESNEDRALPEHFRIESVGSITECRVDGDKVSCTSQLVPMPDNVESWTDETTGTLSGLTLTGTSTTQETRHMTDPSCRTVQRRSGPVTYEFSPDGTVVMGEGLMQYDGENSGTCPGSGSFAGKQWGGQGTGTWSPIE